MYPTESVTSTIQQISTVDMKYISTLSIDRKEKPPLPSTPSYILPPHIQLIHSHDIRKTMNVSQTPLLQRRLETDITSPEMAKILQPASRMEGLSEELRLPLRDGASKHLIVKGI